MSAKIDDYDVDASELASVTLNTDDMKSRIPSFTSQKLCEIIVCDRYFGSYKELAVSCMEELATRRINGDQFIFEDYIENSLKDLPKLDLTVPDIGTVMRQFTKR